MVLVSVILKGETKMAFEIYWVTQMWILSLAAAFSFYRIKNATRELQSIGVFAHSDFMVAYFTFIFSGTIGSTIGQVIEVIYKYDEDDSMHKARGLITARSFMSADLILYFLLHMMIVLVYIRYGSEKQQLNVELERIMRKLRTKGRFDDDVDAIADAY